MSEDSGTKGKRPRWPLIMIALLLVAGAGILVVGKLKGRSKVAFEKGRIHLRSGNAAAAAEEFRTVLARYPDSTPSFEYLIEALMEDGRFSEAEQELSKAPQVGISKAEVAVMRARLFVRRAEGRFRDTASPTDVERCDLILSKDVGPAIALVKGNAKDVEDPAGAYLFLGRAYELKRGVLDRKANLLKRKAVLALKLEDAAEADRKRVQANAASIAAQTALQRATGAYREAIDLAPDKPAPRLALATLLVTYTAIPEREQIGAILAPVIAADPAHRQARLLLARAEAKVRNADAALAQLANIPGQEDDAETLYLKLWVLVDAGRWAEAVPLAEKLRGLKPADFRVSSLYAQALVGRAKLRQDAGQADAAQVDYRLAVDLLQGTLARLPVPWPAARFALGEALLATGSRQQGISALTRGVQDVPKSMPVNRLARIKLLRKHYEIRLKLAKELMADDPDAAATHAVMAFNMRPAGQEAFEVARAAELAAGRAPGEIERLIVQHVAGLEAAGKLDEALAVCEQAPGPAEMPRVAQKRAELLVRRGSYQEAVQAYEALRKHATDSEPAYQLASLYQRLGRADKAQALYEELLADDPRDKVAASRLAGLLAGQGKLDAARKLVTGDKTRLDTTTTQALLLRLALGEGRMDEALKLAQTLAEFEPDKAAPHFFLGMLLWARGQLDEARAAFDAALERDPDFRPAYQRGLVDLQQGRTREAVEFYRKARERFPNDISSVAHLALALQADGQLDESLQLLRDLESALSMQKVKGSLLSWQLAVTEAGAGDIQAALKDSDSATHRYLGSPEDRRGILERIAGLGDAERRSAAASLNLMLVLSQAGAAPAALSVADKLEKLLPGDPLVGCWRAGALDAQNHAEGVEAYGQLIKAHPAFLFPRLLLARSHSRAREYDSAILVLEQALAIASEEEARGVNLLLGGFHERVGQIDEALKCYEAVGDVPAALNNRAYLLATVRDDAKAALPLAEKALKLGGALPQTFDTLGWIHLKLGNADKAVKLLKVAKAGLPSMPTVRYHLGMAYLKAERPQDARAEFKEALALSPNFPGAAEARAALKRLTP